MLNRQQPKTNAVRTSHFFNPHTPSSLGVSLLRRGGTLIKTLRGGFYTSGSPHLRYFTVDT